MRNPGRTGTKIKRIEKQEGKGHEKGVINAVSESHYYSVCRYRF
ncbi:MAG: hypothetical protein ACI9BW_004467, partial [Gammaproteobacteria bacterium]